jgi:hypothetical protein
MKWLFVISLLFFSYFFMAGTPAPTDITTVKRDTVPTGAAPQLFGSKLYEFRNYIVVDSMLMVMGGDTFAIPRWPAIKYKDGDNRWYGYHGTRWRAFLTGLDTVSLSNRINAAVITLNNIGTGFRLLATPGGNIKTIAASNTVIWDSTSNANSLTAKVDTSVIATQFDISLVNSGLSRRGDTTQLGSVNTTNNPLNHNTWINTGGFKLTVQGSTGSGNVLEGINLGSGTGVYGSSVSEYGVLGGSTSLYGVYGTSTTSNAIRGWTTNGNTAAYFEGTAASTNTVIPTVQIKRTTSGTAAAGIGSSIEYYVEKDNGANNSVSNSLRSLLTTATSGAEVSQFEIYGVNAAALARKAAIAGSGQWTWDGYPALTAQVDSTTYKPIAIDGSGNVVKMAGWTGDGSAVLNNIGTGFAWAATPGGNIKRAANSNTILWDSTSTANSLTAKVDTSLIATQSDISGFPTGNGVANQLTYWSGANTIAGGGGMTVNPTTNTVITDTTRSLQLVLAGDSTVTSKIVFSPIKPRPGTMPWRIGLDEQNNQYNGGATIDPVFEIKYGALDGSGRYFRTAWEGSWLPFPGATYEQAEIHVFEMGYGPALGNLVVRPLAYTASWNGNDGTWTHRANLHSFYDWNGQKSLGGFSRGVGEFLAYHNYSGNGLIKLTVVDSGTAAIAAGMVINGQINGGNRDNTTTVYGQNIQYTWETAPVFRATTPGVNSSNFNYVFAIPSSNTGHRLIINKGSGIFDDVAMWIHNDGRTVVGDAFNFWPSYKFQAHNGTNSFVFGDWDANNSTVLYSGAFSHRLTAGAGASGLGAGYRFEADNASNSQTIIADIAGVWNATPTAGAENGDLLFRTRATGTLIEGLRVKSTGQQKWATYGIGTFTGTAAYSAQIDASGNIIEGPAFLTNTASLDFPDTAPGTTSDLTITVTGAAVGQAVMLGTAHASTQANSEYSAWVSATNTVTVRFANIQTVGNINPASGTFRATVLNQ